MNVIKPTPNDAPDLEQAKAKVIELEKKLEDARTEHHRKFGARTFDPAAQLSLQAIARIDGDLHWMRRHVGDLEAAQAAREARGFGAVM